MNGTIALFRALPYVFSLTRLIFDNTVCSDHLKRFLLQLIEILYAMPKAFLTFATTRTKAVLWWL